MPGLLHLLRALTQVASGMVAICIPMLAMLFAVMGMTVPQAQPIGLGAYLAFFACIGIALAAGFGLFACGWSGRFPNAPYRWITAVLLLIPLLAAASQLLPIHTQWLSTVFAWPFALFAGWLLFLCLRPGALGGDIRD